MRADPGRQSEEEQEEVRQGGSQKGGNGQDGVRRGRQRLAPQGSAKQAGQGKQGKA
ncbi:hypothetical protein B8V81_0981 [Paenibacillus pasadenensis]|uniref:Uncharacterized protein n=1 Tax=Paenibacillus pasadenensis TaxID=217090 RepID=A0A2N5N8S6_9BACL|nr:MULTISPECIES: hypothetical protein [Paenibacillus]PLT46757.1 hypothetical protein B8V81_0981 [Paenibacillus pasadenensis]QGG57142.1 hypothetical protein GE073_17140 [Paenibacillus sp. B01]